MVSMALLALIFPLSLRVHIPLHLLCVWASLHPSPLGFILGFALPTAAVFMVERRARGSFMAARQASS